MPLVLSTHPHPPHPHPVPHHAPPHPPHGGYCDPKAPPACALHTDVPFCLEDPDYPSYEIAEKISQDPIFLKKYSDLPDQSANDLVEEITALQESTFDYNYYTGASKGPSPYDASHWIGPEGYLCPSQVDYVKIKRYKFSINTCGQKIYKSPGKKTREIIFWAILNFFPVQKLNFGHF